MYFCASKETNMKQVYFDNAATTQVRDEVVEAMTNSLKNNYGNASSSHSFGRSSKSIIEAIRKEVDGIIQKEITNLRYIFTKGKKDRGVPRVRLPKPPKIKLGTGENKIKNNPPEECLSFVSSFLIILYS